MIDQTTQTDNRNCFEKIMDKLIYLIWGIEPNVFRI